MEWVYRFIGDFGGDPSNITLFGESTGATDILSHMQSAANISKSFFQRAIVQSAIAETNIPDVAMAGWRLSRIMSSLGITSLEELRALPASDLFEYGNTYRATNDGVFFASRWDDATLPTSPSPTKDRTGHLAPPCLVRSGRRSHSRSRSRSRSRSPHPRVPPSTHTPVWLAPSATNQTLMIGDCGNESVLWARNASRWTGPAVVRRLKAICQSLTKANTLFRTYDISASTTQEELLEHVHELINDARVAWPTEMIASHAKRERGRTVYRYVFDQEGPGRPMPHHAADLIYLFDNVPLSISPATPPFEADTFYDGYESDNGEMAADVPSEPLIKVEAPAMAEFDEAAFADMCTMAEPTVYQEDWVMPAVDEWSYNRVRDAMQDKWVAFAYGEAPWKEDKVFVFGPEGETGERSSYIFEGRRRKQLWKQALEPLGMQLVQKIGLELSNGPPTDSRY